MMFEYTPLGNLAWEIIGDVETYCVTGSSRSTPLPARPPIHRNSRTIISTDDHVWAEALREVKEGPDEVCDLIQAGVTVSAASTLFGPRLKREAPAWTKNLLTWWSLQLSNTDITETRISYPFGAGGGVILLSGGDGSTFDTSYKVADIRATENRLLLGWTPYKLLGKTVWASPGCEVNPTQTRLF